MHGRSLWAERFARSATSPSHYVAEAAQASDIRNSFNRILAGMWLLHPRVVGRFL